MANQDRRYDILAVLQQCLDDAKRRDSKHLIYTYKKAMLSVETYPAPLYSASQCGDLAGIGEKTVLLLRDALANNAPGSLQAANPPPPPKTGTKRKASAAGVAPGGSPTKKRKTDEYCPKRRSGGYALMMALLQAERAGDSYMGKADLTNAAAPFCDSRMAATANEHYAGWSAMSTLIQKGLAVKKSSPAKYSLTETGRELAERLWEAEEVAAGRLPVSHLQPGGGGGAPPRPAAARPAPARPVASVNAADDDDEGDESLAAISARLAQRSPLQAPFSGQGHVLGGAGARSKPAAGRPAASAPVAAPARGRIFDEYPEDDQGFGTRDDDGWEDMEAASAASLAQTAPSGGGGRPAPVAEPRSLIGPAKSSLQDDLGRYAPFLFCYVDSSINRVARKDDARLYVDDGKLSCLIEHRFTAINNVHPKFTNALRPFTGERSKSSGYTLSWIDDSVAPNVSSESVVAPTGLKPSAAESALPPRPGMSDVRAPQPRPAESSRPTAPPLAPRLSRPADGMVTLERLTTTSTTTTSAVSAAAAGAARTPPDPAMAKAAARILDAEKGKARAPRSQFAPGFSTAAESLPRMINHGDVISPSAPSRPAVVDPRPKPLKTGAYDVTVQLPRGSENIRLIVDIREKGDSSKRYVEISNAIRKMGIRVDNQPLDVGDFLWVYEMGRSSPLVLDYIVERKQAHDLRSSVMDGRLDEQQFRMRKSGISNVFYLIEGELATAAIEGSNGGSGGMPVERLQNAVLRAQVGPTKCRIRYTSNLKESIAWLALMHQQVCRNVEERGAQACCVQDTQQNAGELLTLEGFKNQCSKSQNLTLKDVFIMGLIQLPRVSPERAGAIAMVYPSYALLNDAYTRCTSKQERVSLLAAIPVGNKTLGQAVSATVYEAFCAIEYDDPPAPNALARGDSGMADPYD